MEGVIHITDRSRVRLDQIDPADTGRWRRDEAETETATRAAELAELQEMLYAAARHAVLVILQGMDASGKDGTVRHVLGAVNPAGCRVVPFKVPTEDELAHDFLWRIHRQTPEKGMIVVFNRSHYEDVVVARVKQLVPERVWRDRYAQVNDFERILIANGTIVVKCFLHISQAEQEERLREREEDVTKAWKLSANDWRERRSWPDYQVAYQDAFAACSTPDAPWTIVPADRKWFRNLVVADTLVRRLRPYRDEWLAILRRRGEAELAAIRAARAESENG